MEAKRQSLQVAIDMLEEAIVRKEEHARYYEKQISGENVMRLENGGYFERNNNELLACREYIKKAQVAKADIQDALDEMK